MSAAVHLAGALSASVWAWLAWASHGTQTLAMLFGAVGAAWVLLAVAWVCGRVVDTKTVMHAVWIWGVAFRVAGFFGAPIFEDDWARYLWDGRQFALTGNPYATAPADHFQDESVPDDFQRVLDEINHPEVGTVYAPVCEFAFAAAHLVAPGKLRALKLILLVADLVTLAMLLRLAPARNALLYAWCPLLIQEVAFTAHPDVLWVCAMVAAMRAFSKAQPVRVAMWCGVAMATKVFAVLIVPFLLVRAGWKYWVLAIGAAAACYAPFWLQGSAADLAGLRAMAKDWEFNATIYAMLAGWLGYGSAKWITLAAYLVIWLVLFGWWMRRVGGTGFQRVGGKAAIQPDWRGLSQGQESRQDHGCMPDRQDACPTSAVLARGELVFGFLFLLSAVVNPWYLLAMLPFIVLRPALWSVGALAVVTLSHAHGLNVNEPSLAPYQQPGWVRCVELGAVAVLFLVARLRRGAASTKRQRD